MKRNRHHQDTTASAGGGVDPVSAPARTSRVSSHVRFTGRRSHRRTQERGTIAASRPARFTSTAHSGLADVGVEMLDAGLVRPRRWCVCVLKRNSARSPVPTTDRQATQPQVGGWAEAWTLYPHRAGKQSQLARSRRQPPQESRTPDSHTRRKGATRRVTGAHASLPRDGDGAPKTLPPKEIIAALAGREGE